ncbi:SET domain-containing protein SmydA-8 [Hyalella azteca]|uniref:SET domain-containing protein SmydA-8 n=1 Tax=Hyalella azteca TaxID=294128 RepID=A0A8B7MXY8_HYAAZ|nr:SET domain-containing protein SmydA-8 [Hyalella azteca]
MVEEGDGRGSALPDKTKAPPGAVQELQSGEERRWRLEYQEPFGRCLIATANLSMGDVIYRDNPIITGPKLTSALLCLGCYKTLTDEHYDCSKCTWTLCGPECETEGYHPYECKVFSKANFKLNLADFGDKNPVYECILPLRCLMLREADPSKWSTLQAMESHDEIRQKSDFWDIEQINVCDFLRKQAKVEYSDALMHTICGILDVNCHEVRSNVPGAPDESRVRGLYPLCAMMSHDCTCNTQHTIMDDHSMVVVASRNIAKGQQITGIYTQLLSGTTERRKHLRYCKFFDCVCRRCSDPTELGTYFSALRCTQCGGPVLCKDPLHPNNTADYRCTECGNEVPNSEVNGLTCLIGAEIALAGENDPTILEQLLEKYSSLLNPNHFHIIALKSSLSQTYGRVAGTQMTDLSAGQLGRKMQCCRDVLLVLDVLDPGISRLRGIMEYELQVALLLLLQRAFVQRQLTRQEVLQRLHEPLLLLQSVSMCLQHEAPSCFEGKIYTIAQRSLAEVLKWREKVKLMPEEKFLPPPVITFDQPKLSEQDLTLGDLLRKIGS